MLIAPNALNYHHLLYFWAVAKEGGLRMEVFRDYRPTPASTPWRVSNGSQSRISPWGPLNAQRI